MPSIKLENVCKYICRDVNLEIFDRELLVLLGPNGAGKSTLLNAIAGFVDYSGSIFFDGSPIDKVPASKRGIGYLFQNLNLFPHLDVTANIAYGLKAHRHTQRQVETRVSKLLHMMKIAHLSSRYPKHLSGGEKQRVALARALALLPRVLLLDEPLSSLDVQTSKYLRTELRQLQRELKVTAIYVTHDLTEAEEMADRIAIINSGRIEQVSSPKEVFFYPKNERVSDFVGAPNILSCDHCHNVGQGVMEVTCGGLPIIVPHDGHPVQKIALFPRDIYISENRPLGPSVNRFQGIITGIDSTNEVVRLKVKARENDLITEISHRAFEDMDLTIGKEVHLILKLRRIRVYEKKDL